MFGPCTATENGAEIKLYNFLKSSIPSLSKRQLREYFKDGNIIVNGVKIREGHTDEMKRLHEGDVVEICPDNCISKSTKLDNIEINVLHATPEFVIINKLSGVSVAPNKEFEQALKCKLWNGTHKDTCRLIYHLEKSLNGLCIIARNASIYKQLRGMMVCGAESKPPVNSASKMITVSNHSTAEGCDVSNSNNTVMTEPDQQQQQQTQPQIALTYRAIVCGFFGEPSSTIELHTKYHEVPLLNIHVLNVSHCRSHNSLSLIDIQPLSFDAHKMGCLNLSQYTLTNDPKVAHIRDKHHMHTEEYLRTFENPVTGGDVKMDNYPTRYLKQIKYALAHAGHPIVGDGDVVKKNKGIHAALVKISILSKPVFSGTNDEHDAAGDVAGPASYKRCEKSNSQKESSSISLEVNPAVPHDAVQSTDSVPQQQELNVSYPITVEIPTPEKFAKLLQREERMWQLARDRDDNVLLEFKQRESRGRQDTAVQTVVVVPTVASDAADSASDNSCVQKNAQNNVTTSCSEDDINGADNNTGVLSKSTEDDEGSSTCMPVEYQTNEASFCDTVFFVNPHVMIPRKSSETLVKEAVRLLTLPKNTAGHVKPTYAHMPDSHDSSVSCNTIRAMEAMKLHGMHIPLQSATTHSTSDMFHDLNTGDTLTTCSAAMSSMVPINASVLDLGTGSGCLLLSCLQKLNQHNDMASKYHKIENYGKVTGVGVDISVGALEVAQENVRRLGLNSNGGDTSGVTSMVQFVEGSFESLLPVLLLSLQKKDNNCGCNDADAISSVADCDVNLTASNNSNGTHNTTHADTQTNATTSTVSSYTQEAQQTVPPFDIILCNPPYSTKKDRARLSQCTKVYEPDVALYAPRSVSVHDRENEDDSSATNPAGGVVAGGNGNVSNVADAGVVNSRDHSDDQQISNCDGRCSANSSDDASHIVFSGLARGDKSEKKLIGGSMGAYHMIARSIRDIHKYQVSLLSSHCKNSSQAAMTVNSGQPCSEGAGKKDTTVSVMAFTKSAVTSGPSTITPVGLLIKDGAYLILEMGFGQVKQVKSIFSSVECLEFVHSVKDHLGLVRCVVYKYCLEVSVAKSGLI